MNKNSNFKGEGFVELRCFLRKIENRDCRLVVG